MGRSPMPMTPAPTEWKWWEHTINPNYVIRREKTFRDYVPEKDLLTLWWGLPIYFWLLLVIAVGIVGWKVLA